jgi:hypothetical protein
MVHVDDLALCQGSTWYEQSEGGSIGSHWRVITVRNKPRGRKVKPVTDITSTNLPVGYLGFIVLRWEQCAIYDGVRQQPPDKQLYISRYQVMIL